MNHVTGVALLGLERDHLVRLAVWATASILVGLTVIRLSRDSQKVSPAFWRHFGIQSAAWGLVDLLIVAAAWGGLAPRDLPAAIELDRFLWLNIGLDVGYAMVGLTLLVFGMRAPRRAGLMGAGAAIVLQGVALAALDAILSGNIVR
jgi:hypothetical protein